MERFMSRVCISFIIVLCLLNCSFSKPHIAYFQDSIPEVYRKEILSFMDVLSDVYYRITGVDTDKSFGFYCDKLPYLTWSHNRGFWNIGCCEDYCFERIFYREFPHELAQLFFVDRCPGMSNSIDGGIYKKYFSPYYVGRFSEHISFSLATIFWVFFSDEYGVDKSLAGSYPFEMYKISLDSEYFKVLKDFWAATIHHTEVDYHSFLDFSFFTGQMLFTKLYLYDRMFFRNLLSECENYKFSSVADYANAIIAAFKRSGIEFIDGVPVEEFVWGHPDFRRFKEDYKRTYYFDIATVDYSKKREGKPFFLYLTKINPTNFCFIVTSFKHYNPQLNLFNQLEDNELTTVVVHYKILDRKGRVLSQGTSHVMRRETDICGNVVPQNLSNGRYSIEANVVIDGKILEDRIDFYVDRAKNFFVNDLPGYAYLVMRNVRINDRCYYLKMSLIGDLLKLDELNEVPCDRSSTNDVVVGPNGDVVLKNIIYKGYRFSIKLKQKNDLFFYFTVLEH